nr:MULTISPECIES: hypothetical protein [unclassified Pseudomonas]
MIQSLFLGLLRAAIHSSDQVPRYLIGTFFEDMTHLVWIRLYVFHRGSDARVVQQGLGHVNVAIRLSH